MSYIGPLRDLKTLMSTVTPETLPRLVRDLLVSKGHKNIRVTDGPGDGCRDLHSIGKDGVPMLTQCKCHQDLDASVTSKEIGELALGLVKFGYTRGLFVTTSGISPQAKREMLNDFPGLEFGFLDGQELLGAVLDDVALTALWFDGERLALVNTAVSVPAIVRRHEGDMPLRVPVAFAPEGTLRIPNVEQTVVVRHGIRESASRFAPYRPPSELSPVEGMFADLKCTELLMRGAQTLSDVQANMAAMGEALAATIAPAETAFAIRLGRPAITPLGGTSAGSRVLLDVAPLTFVHADGRTQTEHGWLMPSSSSEWTEKSFARQSQAPAARLYNARLDACAAFELITPPTENGRGIFRQRQDREQYGWNHSVFVLCSQDQDLSKIHPTLPEEVLRWTDGRKFASYFHADIQGGGEMLANSHEQIAEIAVMRRELVDAERVRLDAIRDAHEVAGSEIVTPRIARHMVCLLVADPLPSYDLTTMRTCDIMWNMDVPSPVAPKARRLRATVCWRVTGTISSDDLEAIDVEPITHAWLDDLGDHGKFLVVHFSEAEDAPRGSCTDVRLRCLGEELETLMPPIETQLSERGVRATADYWMAKFLIDCRGILPVPDPANPADWPGPPGCLSPMYFALMNSLDRTFF